MLKIYLADLVHDYLPGNYVVPLNIGLLAAYLRAHFLKEVNIRLFKSPSKLLDTLKTELPPHLIGFSNYSWNQELNRKITEKISRQFPDTIICAGGPHIRTNEKGIADYLKEHAVVDYYCMFEGEIPLGRLIQYFLSKGRPVHAHVCDETMVGVAYLREGQLVYAPTEFKKGVIEDIPSPYLSGVLDDFINSSHWVPLMETNRGCPFHCTFCVWGISAMDKVRVFPLERIIEEIRFVAKRSPSPRWIFADANFGMLERDVEIAREIRKMANQRNILRNANLWWAKNSSRHTVEIAKILGELSDPLAAVQTMDETVLKIIKRDNIRMSTMTDLLAQFHENGLRATTDVLVGMPGETFQSHTETLRRSLSLGFDSIDVGNIRLLPGSEMESDETRIKYQLKTKYRLISGSYGKYDGEPIFEFEESVRASKDITEEEMLSLRVVHFFIMAFWNLGIAKPLLRWMYLEQNINPLDVILSLTNPKENPFIKEFLVDFNEEAKAEWFDTAERLTDYYSVHFDELMAKGFLKMNFKYLAKILLDRDFAKRMLQTIASKTNNEIALELVQFCHDRIYFLDYPVQFKKCTYSESLVNILKKLYPLLSFTSNVCHFEIEAKTKSAIDYELEKVGLKKDPVRALALTLESYRSYFLFDFSFSPNGKKEVVGDLAGSFDYHAQLGLPQENKLDPSNV